MKMRVVFFLVLALFAFATFTLVTLNSAMPELHNVPCNVTNDGESPPVQPLGDPVDNDGDVPHLD